MPIKLSGLNRFNWCVSKPGFKPRSSTSKTLLIVSLKKSSTHTYTSLTALCPGLPGWAGTRKVKPIWILLNQQTVSGSGISSAICKYACHSKQITMHHSSFFIGRMPFLPPNQQHQSTERMKSSMPFHIILLTKGYNKQTSNNWQL